MYVSRTVRHIRDDPVPGTSITLLLRFMDDTDPEAVAERVRGLDGTIQDDLRFGGLKVTVPQRTVAEICDPDGLEAVETDNVHTIDLDGAGEDVTY